MHVYFSDSRQSLPTDTQQLQDMVHWLQELVYHNGLRAVRRVSVACRSKLTPRDNFIAASSGSLCWKQNFMI